MIAKQFIPALLAIAGLATAQKNDKCTQSEIEINSQADADSLSTCSTLKGNVVIGNSSDNTIDLSGPKKIDGDLIAKQNGKLITLRSTSLGEITGALSLTSLEVLSTLGFSSLTSVGSIEFTSLTALQQLSFTTGISKAKDVKIADTKLGSLDGIDLASVNTMFISSNSRLIEFTSALGSVSDTLKLDNNAPNLKVKFPNLKWAANLDINNVALFEVPSLEVVNRSMTFNKNTFPSFLAPNLTETSKGDIAFVSNGKMANISMPELTKVAGGFLIANNTGLEKLDGFPQLKSVGGAVKLRGDFESVEFPELDDVVGAFDLVSTLDIKESCRPFDKLAPKSQGGNDHIQGSYTCKGNISDANNDTDTKTGGKGKGSDSGGDDSAAGALAINVVTILSLTAAGVFFQMW